MTNKWFLLLALCLSVSIQAANDTIIRHYIDTVTTVTQVPDSTLKQREVLIPADSTDRRGHYVQTQIGAGYGSLGYSLDGVANHVNGSLSALIQLQYAYFFHRNVGISVGVWFTNYASIAHLGGDYRWLDQTDTDLEHYDHTASIQKWRELQIIHNVGIPVSLQFQAQKENAKARFFASIGVAPSYSVFKQYKVLEGAIEHSGYYPAWKLQLKNAHEFTVKQYANHGRLRVRPQVTCFIDLGVLVQLSPQVDLFIGGYGNISATDANSSQKKEIGWKDADFTFMEEYNGAYATTLASASHPWEAGLKLGIHWHHIPPDEHKIENYYEHFMREEIVTSYVERSDTTIVKKAKSQTKSQKKSQNAKKSKALKFKNVYFKFDSDKLPSEAQKYLLSIIEVLNRMPDGMIRLVGHTSEEGADWYNNSLSKRRANAVRDFLIANGVDRKRIKVIGYGARKPSKNADNSRKESRRVEIIVIRDANK